MSMVGCHCVGMDAVDDMDGTWTGYERDTYPWMGEGGGGVKEGDHPPRLLATGGDIHRVLWQTHKAFAKPPQLEMESSISSFPKLRKPTRRIVWTIPMGYKQVP